MKNPKIGVRPRFHTAKSGFDPDFLPLAAVIVASLLLSGCSSVQRQPPLQVWPDMRVQEKFKPQLWTDLFPDHRMSRRPPEGTIKRGYVHEDIPAETGMEGANYTGKNPLPITPELLAEGQWRFNTYCSPCHDRTGTGRGMVPRRALNWQPANLTEDRVVQLSDGDIFNAITNGRRTMPAYFFQNRVNERWAIIAYLRVLQRAANGSLNDVPEELRAGVPYKGN